MWNGQPIILNCWTEFATALKTELCRLGHNGLVLVRNFEAVSDDPVRGVVNRLEIAQLTGTDRDATSDMCNVDGHDYDHSANPAGKAPHDLIYAYVVDAATDPYVVYIYEQPEVLDLTETLELSTVVLVYDAAKLARVSKNEHWFIGDPREALLAIFKLPPEEDLPDEDDE